MTVQIYKLWLKQLLWQSHYYYRYTYNFMELLASLIYTKHNKN